MILFKVNLGKIDRNFFHKYAELINKSRQGDSIAVNKFTNKQIEIVINYLNKYGKKINNNQYNYNNNIITIDYNRNKIKEEFSNSIDKYHNHYNQYYPKKIKFINPFA